MTCRVRPRSQASIRTIPSHCSTGSPPSSPRRPTATPSSRIVAGRLRLGSTTSLRCPVAARRSRACAARSKPTQTTRSSLRGVGSAYGMLFEGIGGPKTVSPYESVHRDGGRLFGAPAAEMEAILAAHDLSVAASAHEAPDHLAVELAAAARLLAEGEPDADAIIERLRGWVPAFAADCAAADSNGFWAGAAAVLIAIVGLATRQPANAEIPDATKH